MKIKVSKSLATAIFAVALPFSLQAQTWKGVDGEYTLGSNWIGEAVPVLTTGDTALITGGDVTYTPGGDLFITNGSTLQISGGSWSQAGAVSWIQMNGGNLLVDGGEFSQGSSGNILRNETSSITVSSGAASFNGNFLHDVGFGSLSLSGGVMNIGNEFRNNVAGFDINGGALAVTTGIAFNGSESVNISSGSVSVDASWNDLGFFAAEIGSSVNFTTGSTGTLRLRGYDTAGSDFETILVNGNRLSINGASTTIADFITTSSGGDLLVSVIPEPSSILMLLTGMGLLITSLHRRK